jgi:hypothetical protein
MRQTVTNLLGTLPPQFFTVRVHTVRRCFRAAAAASLLTWPTSLQVGENLAQLMYSVMMTGYMFRNTQASTPPGPLQRFYHTTRLRPTNACCRAPTWAHGLRNRTHPGAAINH